MILERLSLVLPHHDKRKLQAIAQSEGEAMSVLIRRILREEFKRRGGEQAVKEREAGLSVSPQGGTK